jgi:hypothetical protein
VKSDRFSFDFPFRLTLAVEREYTDKVLVDVFPIRWIGYNCLPIAELFGWLRLRPSAGGPAARGEST